MPGNGPTRSSFSRFVSVHIRHVHYLNRYFTMYRISVLLLALSFGLARAGSHDAAKNRRAHSSAISWKQPATVVIEGHRLVEAKLRVKVKDKRYLTQLASLKTEADSWLKEGPWSVLDKPNPPVNGTINDYLSQAPYW